jgi:hypothetical protein
LKKKITGTIPVFAVGPRKTKKNLCRDGRSQDLPATDFWEGETVIEGRLCIRFGVNGESATETLTMIQKTFGEKILNLTQVVQQHARFKTVHTSADYDEHTGRHKSCSTPETVARIEELFRQDRRRTNNDIAEDVGIGYGTCLRVLTKELIMGHANGF